MEFLESNIFLIALTFLVFWGARKLQQRTGWVALNPILVTIFVLIAYLKVTGISFETYNESGRMIEFWLKPAIVALGVPLYTQLKAIRRQLLPILLSQLAGCVAGIISVVLVAKAMGASTAVIISMAPKSVTTPIAMEVVAPLGGIPSLTAAIVICVGLFGAICGFKVLQIGHVSSPIAKSISMGTAAHALGTTRAAECGHIYGAYASLGLIVNGILTAMLTPSILELMGIVP